MEMNHYQIEGIFKQVFWSGRSVFSKRYPPAPHPQFEPLEHDHSDLINTRDMLGASEVVSSSNRIIRNNVLKTNSGVCHCPHRVYSAEASIFEELGLQCLLTDLPNVVNEDERGGEDLGRIEAPVGARSPLKAPDGGVGRGVVKEVTQGEGLENPAYLILYS
ncbi:hypothetical protein Tco_0774628 [Tanacetum coccineum]|uniref:Uncharacterized protein n=1 Tax=Tanacetum coccineum TaxID=301880 RepID=A0ABQ4ZSR9_9ASTR